MVPQIFIKLDKLPYTLNNKKDRKTINNIEVEFDEMKSGFEMEDDCEFLLRRVTKKLAYLRENMDVFDPDGELESMFDDEDLEDMRNIY